MGDDPGGSEGFFGERVAAAYDERSAGMFDPAVVGPAVDLLEELAGDGAALEFAIGTGRIALPLAKRGVREARVPELQRLPLGQTVLPWRAEPSGTSAYVYDVVTQRLSGQHYVKP